MMTNLVNAALRWARSIPLLLIIAMPSLSRAQFLYKTNNGAITITGYNGSGGAVAIPTTINGFPVVQISTNAFASKGTITSIAIPASITNIAIGALSSCAALTNIIIDPANERYSSLSGVLFDKAQTTLIQFPSGVGGKYIVPQDVTAIADQAFAACPGLTNIVLPTGLLMIGTTAFSNCTGLTSLEIPPSVGSIPDEAFSNCSALANLIIPGSVTNIGAYAFSFCGITELTIPEGVVSIGTASFSYSENLIRVRISKTVKSIGVFAFSSCANLTEAYFAGDSPPVGSDVFAGAQNLKVYYWPGTTGWTSSFGGAPTAVWDATISRVSVTNDQYDGVALTITGGAGLPFVVETSNGLINPQWISVSTNRTTEGPLELNGIPATYSQGAFRLRSP